MKPIAVLPLFVVTAVAEIAGCYFVYLWTRGSRSPLLLVGAALALGAFAWLLSFHPNASRAYVRAHAQEMSDSVCDAHIRLYVNQHSLDIGDDGLRAINRLVAGGANAA